jgi:MoxR-like ATPase
MEENQNNENVPHLNLGGTDLTKITQSVFNVKNEVAKYVIGQEEMIDLLLIGVFSGGHVLLEGVPGIAKTLTAKVMAKTLSVGFSRIQFTPDLMPSDIIGTSVYNQQMGKFNFNKGPIFSNIILIDEINRSPAKTQAALFEVMEERQITYDGITYPMEFPFLVMATQNPIEQEGTYRLPEAQLDRFLFRVKMKYPTLIQEEQIMLRYRDDIKSPDLHEIKSVFTVNDLKEIQELIKKIKVELSIINYIARIVQNTREHGRLFLGASPRASLAILKSSKTYAAMRGRDFVTPDDVQFVAMHVLNHRIILNPESEMEGITPEDVIMEIIKKVEVPR